MCQYDGGRKSLCLFDSVSSSRSLDCFPESAHFSELSGIVPFNTQNDSTVEHITLDTEEKQLFFRLLSVGWLFDWSFVFSNKTILIFTFKVQRHQNLSRHILNSLSTVFLKVTSNEKCDIDVNLQCFEGPAQPRAFYNRLCIYVQCLSPLIHLALV